MRSMEPIKGLFQTGNVSRKVPDKVIYQTLKYRGKNLASGKWFVNSSKKMIYVRSLFCAKYNQMFSYIAVYLPSF